MERRDSIPMSSPDLCEVDLEAVSAVLRTPWLSFGPQLEAFEQAMAAYVGVRYAVGVSSGTAGLHLGVIAAGVREGDLVLTTPFSFVASANCILYERAIPIFVDVDPQTLALDPSQVTQAAADLAAGGAAARRWLPPALRRRWRSPRLLRAVLAVDVFGQPADYDALRAVAEQYGLSLIEDACASLRAEYKGRRAGTLGDVAVFAF